MVVVVVSFDILARHYRWMELLLAGEKLQRCRTAFLGQIAPPRNVLICGEGNGRFLAECVRKFPTARFTCLDASARMLALAKRRLERLGLPNDQVHFIHSDALQWRSPERGAFDLIVTHFFLDCFTRDQVEMLVRRLSSAATPNASWLLGDFQIPSDGFQKVRARVIHFMMYAFFRVVTKLPAHYLTPPDEFLSASGFILRQRHVTDLGLLHTDWWETSARVQQR